MYGRYVLNVTYEAFPTNSGEESTFHRFSGFAVRTFLYRDIIKKIYSVDIHKVGGLRPFSVTPMYAYGRSGLKIYGYKSRVDRALFQVRLLDVIDPLWVVDKLKDFKEVSLDVKNYVINLASISILGYKDLVNSSHPINEFIIKFITPTSVRSPSIYISLHKSEGKYKPRIRRKSREKGIYLPLPYPNLIFKNLLRMFRKFSGLDDLPYDEIREYIENDNIFIKSIPRCIKTKAIKLSQSEKYIGFIGEVSYELDGDKEMRKYIHSLIQYARYSNIGIGRSAGLGWVMIREIK